MKAHIRSFPARLDDTPVDVAQKGRRKNAPGRGSVPLAESDKDKEIKRLTALVQALHNEST